MTDEFIVIAGYDPAWPMQYAHEKEMILGAIGTYIIRIEHVGSTAVSGLGAKPVIDITASLHTMSDLETCVAALRPLGYEHRGEAGIPGRQFFLKVSRETGKRTHHLHLIEQGNPMIDDQVAFRDHLRIHPDAASAYVRLKMSLAAQYGDDRESYTNAKSQFILAALTEAK
jgi:GrpB-like predicted nucleotidyltransferase (UPF0157 family)